MRTRDEMRRRRSDRPFSFILDSMNDDTPWTVVVTAWDGPSKHHPLLIRLTIDSGGLVKTTVVASITEAGRQLEAWLTTRAGAVDDDVTPAQTSIETLAKTTPSYGSEAEPGGRSCD